MAQLQPLSAELEKQREEYVQLLRAGQLSPYSLPAVASVVEEAVLARAWARTSYLSEAVGSRIYVLSVAGTHPRVKVGMTACVRSRIVTHLNEYHCNGHGLVDAWISNAFLDAGRVETGMHKLLRISHRTSYRREEYPGTDFESICDLAAYFDVRLSLTEDQVRFHEWKQQDRARTRAEGRLRVVEPHATRAVQVGDADGETDSS
ncbi:GIY-YIG nuclease family protein [Kitasatospora sp. NPDC015120]|uniref:GIY-YIG nuclease family protein n=1 Tax=Kitasatospora sp. NPDC015120 TaxID=3364023 RepID=UPI0036F48647